MPQTLAQIALVVPDYDDAIAHYVGTLGFRLIEDTPLPEPGKRWVVVRPDGPGGCSLLLARATTPEQASRIGNQTGGRVFLFLHTDDIDRDLARWQAAGLRVVRALQTMPYGRVAVVADLYGNLWDLIEPSARADAGSH